MSHHCNPHPVQSNLVSRALYKQVVHLIISIFGIESSRAIEKPYNTQWEPLTDGRGELTLHHHTSTPRKNCIPHTHKKGHHACRKQRRVMFWALWTTMRLCSNLLCTVSPIQEDPHKHSHVHTSHILTHVIPTIRGHSLYDAQKPTISMPPPLCLPCASAATPSQLPRHPLETTKQPHWSLSFSLALHHMLHVSTNFLHYTQCPLTHVTPIHTFPAFDILHSLKPHCTIETSKHHHNSLALNHHGRSCQALIPYCNLTLPPHLQTTTISRHATSTMHLRDCHHERPPCTSITTSKTLPLSLQRTPRPPPNFRTTNLPRNLTTTTMTTPSPKPFTVVVTA